MAKGISPFPHGIFSQLVVCFFSPSRRELHPSLTCIFQGLHSNQFPIQQIIFFLSTKNKKITILFLAP